MKPRKSATKGKPGPKPGGGWIARMRREHLEREVQKAKQADLDARWLAEIGKKRRDV